MTTPDVREALKQHREVARVFHELRRDNDGDITKDMHSRAGMSLDQAHMIHWYALQDSGVPAGKAGNMCAAISRSNLP